MSNSKKLTVAGLAATGWEPAPKQSSDKYVRYVSSHESHRYDILIGKSGAVRKSLNDSPAVAASISITGGPLHRALQETGSHRWTTVPQALSFFNERLAALRSRSLCT
jgi:hypothetical protein